MYLRFALMKNVTSCFKLSYYWSQARTEYPFELGAQKISNALQYARGIGDIKYDMLIHHIMMYDNNTNIIQTKYKQRVKIPSNSTRQMSKKFFIQLLHICSFLIRQEKQRRKRSVSAQPTG